MNQISTNSTQSSNSELKSPAVGKEHVAKALKASRPSVSTKERLNYEKIYADFLGSREDFKNVEYTGMRQTLA